MVDAGATNPRPEVVRQGGRAIAPPYVSYSTFRTMLEWLGSEGVPLRFDRSFWESKFSGSNGAQLSAALRFLGLLWDDEPNPELERLATATPYERRTTLRLLLIDSYLAVPFDELPRATPAMVRDWFRAYPIDGHTLRKAISFFVNAAKDTEFPLSNAVRKMAKSKSPAPSSSASGETRGSKPAVANRPAAAPAGGRAPRPTERTRAQPSQRTIALESGGTITVGVDVDLFRLSDRDREFVLSLVGLARSYEEEQQATEETEPASKESPSGSPS